MRRYYNYKIWSVAFLLLIFSTGCCNPGPNSALAPPTAVSVIPLAGAVGVCPSTAVTVTFSLPMQPATINGTTFTLTVGTPPVAVEGVITADPANTVFTFTPSSSLALSTLYTATITTGAIDEYGIALASNFVWTFTTSSEACAPPTVISVTPADGACPSTVVTATFSEAMNPGTINTSTFLLNVTDGEAVQGVVTYAASTATFTPNDPLLLSTSYTATITTGAQDLNGDALANNYVWSFTTAAAPCAPPTVILTAGNCSNALVLATFSEAMIQGTIIQSPETTFTLTITGGAAVPGTVTYDPSSYVATFTPSAPGLTVGTSYTAEVTTAAEDLAGTPLASDVSLIFTPSGTGCGVPVGSTCNFGALGGSTVTNTGPSNVSADVGVWAGTAITGFPPGTLSNGGTFHAGDAAAQTAQGDLTTAYDYAFNLPPGTTLPADIGGKTYAPGVYSTTSAQPSLGITGDLALSGDANGVWIFQVISTLTTAANNSNVILSGGAQSGNVFWQVGSSATLGTTTTFQGIIMAQASITLGTGATLDGSALARTGGVTLDDNLVNVPSCP